MSASAIIFSNTTPRLDQLNCMILTNIKLQTRLYLINNRQIENKGKSDRNTNQILTFTALPNTMSEKGVKNRKRKKIAKKEKVLRVQDNKQAMISLHWMPDESFE